MEPTFFGSAAEFRDWLEENHATVSELLVGFNRKASGHGITYPEALDEALSFGWIDGVRKRVDAETYAIRFTPRLPGSSWSAVNTHRAGQLIASGRMRPAGVRAFRERDEGATRRRAHERESAQLEPALAATLRAHGEAAAYFAAQPPGYRKIATFWVMSAKKPETRARRLAQLIARSEQRCRLDLLKPNG